MRALNVGSGQRRFEGGDWLNIDCVRRPGQEPDVIADARDLKDIPDDWADLVVLCHVLEHFVLPDAEKVVASCYRVLKPGGSLIVALPNMRALAQRWLMGMIDDYIFFVNTWGAYQGEDGDCHRWGYTADTLPKLLDGSGRHWSVIKQFDHREIPGMNLPTDWWTREYEAVKA